MKLQRLLKLFTLKYRTCGRGLPICKVNSKYLVHGVHETMGLTVTKLLAGTHNAARRFLDGVSSFSSSVTAISSVPAKSLSGWMADKIAPHYWRPNSDITNCHLCDRRLDVADQKIHHCRACGEGFCSDCSDYKRPVPERGWGDAELVRVCRDCFEPQTAAAARRSRSHGSISSSAAEASEAVHARK